MRKDSTDNFERIALLGNNVYDIVFMYYLFLSQNVNAYYCDKYVIREQKYEEILKNIAYYLGTVGPILIDDKDLRRLFKEKGIPEDINLPNISSEDIVNQINMCLNSDAVYVCNVKGKLDGKTVFILGYLMAKEQEIFFWNDIDKTEWLMSCISKKNNHGYKEIVQFPLEIIRSLAYPYLFKRKINLKPGKYRELVVTEEGMVGVDRNTEFNLDVENFDSQKQTVSLLGSLNKQLDYIKDKAIQFKNDGYELLAPKLSNVKTGEEGFVIFEDDISDNPIIIEADFIEKCLKSEKIIVCNKDGYVGNTVMFEIGYLLSKKKNIEFIEVPNDNWLMEVVDYYLKNNDTKQLKYRK